MQLPAIKECPDAALEAWFAARGQPRYRLAQVLDWLYGKWVDGFEQMANVPLALRQDLALSFSPFSLVPAEILTADDGTVKWLLRLADGETVETVLLQAPDRATVCVSTQVGCPVRCAFCASGRGDWVRDLGAAEIIDQVIVACRHLGRRIDNVVVMGMGEPLLNFDATVAALDLLCRPDRIGLGARHVTISTSGIAPAMRRLADLGRQWHLALSLHGVSDAVRARIIPPRWRFPLAEVMDACRYYRRRTGRIVTFEYAVTAGLNDGEDDARQLAALARDLDAKINLIPCNPSDSSHQSPARAAIVRFQRAVAAAGGKITLRQRRGESIQAACGQLRRRHTPPTTG